MKMHQNSKWQCYFSKKCHPIVYCRFLSCRSHFSRLHLIDGKFSNVVTTHLNESRSTYCILSSYRILIAFLLALRLLMLRRHSAEYRYTGNVFDLAQ